MRCSAVTALACTFVCAAVPQVVAAPGLPKIPDRITIDPDDGYVPEADSRGRGVRNKGPTQAQVKTVLTLGPTADLVSHAGSRVRFSDLLETSLISWTTGKVKDGKCAYAAQAIPVRPDGVQWDNTPKTLASVEMPGTKCTSAAPAAAVRSSADRIWAGLSDGSSLHLAGFEPDGADLGFDATHGPLSGPVNLFVLSHFLVVQGGKSAVGFPFNDKGEAIAIPGITREVVASNPEGWVAMDDGTLFNLIDPRDPPPKKSYRLPVKPGAQSPVLMARSATSLVIAGCTGNQLGVWSMDDSNAKTRLLYRGNALGCPGSVRVTSDGKIVVASMSSGKAGPETSFVTLLAPSGKPIGPSLQVRLPASAEPSSGLTQAADWATLLWAAPDGSETLVRGTDIRITESGLVWMASANQ